ncbi:MAG: prolipoprotein diacylglyceryl transferase [Dehalococcoidia bacterium]|nr:MAG: prolipoprotein diacylglyceryl transferase [Dehalococcoidia bacterium]
MNAIEINVSPVLWHIGGMEVRWYGVMMALGVMVLILWTYNQIRRGAKLSYDHLLGGALVGIPSGIVFARLLHVVDGSSNINYYFSQPLRIIGGSGLTIYGAILGAALGVWVYSRLNKLNYSYLVDVITPGIILAQVLGRVGCLFNGCCYGKELIGSPFNIVYTNPESFAPISFPVQPTQFYELLFLLALFAVIMVFRSKFKPDGVQFMFYLGMYSLWRIGIGFLRVGTPFAFGLEEAQVIGIIVAIICFSLIAYRVRKAKSTPPTVELAATESGSES